MNTSLTFVGIIIAVALAFDFVNGFHDASNSIATLVATRVLRPFQAVLWASSFNFVALFIFNTEVARTVGSGMIALDSVTPLVILAGLLGAISWGLLSWWMRMPTSSSHALLGGYAGAAICNSGIRQGVLFSFAPIIASGWIKTLAFIIVAPLLGFIIGWVLMALTQHISCKMGLKSNMRIFSFMQLFSSAFLSLMHGANDAQKTAGIIAGLLTASGYYRVFTIPNWVLWLSYGTIGLGTMFGGWRIVETMGRNLTRLQPNGGFCAESASALSICVATLMKLPVSTTQTTAGAILGVGINRNIKAVRLNLAVDILWTWISTIPVAALIGWLVMAFIIKLGY